VKSYRPPYIKFRFLWQYIVQDFTEDSCGILLCRSLQYTCERTEGNMENCQESLQASQSIRAKKKGGGAQCVESSNIKGVTQFKNLNTLCSHNLKRINLTDILHRCPYMWNCSNDRGSIFGRGCNFFYHSTHTVCVCVCLCVDVGNPHYRLWKLTVDCVRCVKAVGALKWLTLS